MITRDQLSMRVCSVYKNMVTEEEYLLSMLDKLYKQLGMFCCICVASAKQYDQLQAGSTSALRRSSIELSYLLRLITVLVEDNLPLHTLYEFFNTLNHIIQFELHVFTEGFQRILASICTTSNKEWTCSKILRLQELNPVQVTDFSIVLSNAIKQYTIL